MRNLMLFVAFALIAASMQSDGAHSDAKQPGVWTPYNEFAQLHTACYRVYSCGPATDVLHSGDTRVEATPPEVSWGVCSGFDSCDVCNTNPPSTPCEWELVPK